jgi:hypothetical protein
MKTWSLTLGSVIRQCRSVLATINGANYSPKCKTAMSCGHFPQVMKAGIIGADVLAYR